MYKDWLYRWRFQRLGIIETFYSTSSAFILYLHHSTFRLFCNYWLERIDAASDTWYRAIRSAHNAAREGRVEGSAFENPMMRARTSLGSLLQLFFTRFLVAYIDLPSQILSRWNMRILCFDLCWASVVRSLYLAVHHDLIWFAFQRVILLREKYVDTTLLIACPRK